MDKKIFYNSEDINIDYSQLGNPGKEPFTRGIYSNMYSGKSFTMRQLTGFGSPEDTNKRMKYMLENGATGLSILFDFPTIQMYDSDDIISLGHVGFSGVCVDSIEDMHTLFKDININKISISIVTHYPSNTAILFSMFLAMAEERGISWSDLRGSVQNDIIMEEVVRCGSEFITPINCFRLQCDNVEFIRNELPKWNPVTLNGYNLRECGTSIITETAVAIINGIDTIQELVNRGYEANNIASRIAFFWSIGNNFFEEIARLRASRRIWCNVLKDRFKISDIKSLMLRCHSQTSGISLTRQEPLNNIIRASYQALAAVLGGTQSLHVDSFDEAYSVPTEEAALVSLRTQQIIQDETNIIDIADPLGGSWYIESLTNGIEEKIYKEIFELGGFDNLVNLISSGKLHDKIHNYAYQQQKEIEEGIIPVIGVNKYQNNNVTEIPQFKYPENVEKIQKEKLLLLKKNRNNNKVKESLNDLENVCKEKVNIIPYVINCAKARCTEGEMFNSFKKAFGLWDK